MAIRVLNLHGQLGHPDYDPELNANIVYVSRRQWWGPGRLLDGHLLRNPHLVDKPCRARGCHGAIHTREESIAAYCGRLLAHPELLAEVPPLRGRVLACWCSPRLCHGHILAALAELPEVEMRAALQRLVADPSAALPTVAERDLGDLVVSSDPSPHEEMNIVRVRNRVGQEALRQRIAEAAERDARGEQ